MNQKSITPTTVTINWCTAAAKTEALTQFFVMHADTQYISHSELQGARATSTTSWRSDLATTLHDEISATLAQDPSTADKLIAMAESNGILFGMALVSLGDPHHTAIPYASLDDLIVHPDRRSTGLGRQLLAWVEQQMLARGIQRLFLESGAGNHAAHRFFENHGYATISVVKMKELCHA